MCIRVCAHAFACDDVCVFRLITVMNATLSPSVATVLDAESKDCIFVRYYYHLVNAHAHTHTVAVPVSRPARHDAP